MSRTRRRKKNNVITNFKKSVEALMDLEGMAKNRAFVNLVGNNFEHYMEAIEDKAIRNYIDRKDASGFGSDYDGTSELELFERVFKTKESNGK